MAEQMTSRYSIILPVRDGGQYVKLCINSIFSQTLSAFNLIVLDNYSTDGTLEYLRSLTDERVILYPSSASLTIEENWARISSVDKNEFITLIGHDDILLPEYLAEMELLINKYPTASLYQTHFTYIDAKGKLLRSCKPMAGIENGPQFLKTVLQNKIDIMGTGFMMRSTDFNQLGGMPSYPNLIFSDLELWLKLSMISFKATSSNECFSFRTHQGTTSVTSDLKFQQAFEKFIYFLLCLKDKDIEYKKIVEKYSNEFLFFYCKSLSHRLMRTPTNKRNSLTVSGFVRQCIRYAELLGSRDNFRPTSSIPILIARIIDSSAVGRSLFLLFKKMYKNPLLK